MGITLEDIKQEADMLQTRLNQGDFNSKELKSFLVRVKAIPSPNDSKKKARSKNDRLADMMSKLDRSMNKKQS